MSETPDPITPVIAAEIARRGLTLTAVAEASGIQRTLLSAWLAGRKTVTVETAGKVMAHLGIVARPRP